MKDKQKILFLNHDRKECGIYQFGLNICKSILEVGLKNFEFLWSEVSNEKQLITLLDKIKPKIIVLNYTPVKHSWIYKSSIENNNLFFIDILHEYNIYNNYKTNNIFKYHLVANPDITDLKLPDNFYSLPRLLPECPLDPYVKTPITKVGCIGFGSLDRGWLQVLDIVERDLDKAEINFHMPFNSVIDINGSFHANKTEKLCKSRVLKPGITLNIDHTFLNTEQLVKKISQNTINLALYQEKNKKGISSSIDIYLASRRPLGISSSPMYNHLKDIKDLICVDNNNINDIINRGVSILEPYQKKWSKSEFVNSFESTLLNIIKR